MDLQSLSPVPEPVDHSLLNRQELLYSTLNDLSKWLFFTSFCSVTILKKVVEATDFEKA